MVFLHRQGSLRPFTRHFPTEDVLDLLQLKDMPDGSTQVQGWLFLDFFFLLENLFSRDNQRLSCQVSSLTIFSFSSYHFFLSLVNASKVPKLTQVLKIYRQVCITF